MQWFFRATTSIGGRREQQDRLCVISSPDGGQHLVVVADGAGGHANGAMAAQTVVSFAEESADALWQSDDPEASLERFCQHAHIRVLALSENTEIACTTVVALLLRGDEAYWAHVGDSRLYFIRNRKVLIETRDHSLRQLAIDQSERTPDSDKYNKHSIPANQLYMCLGIPGDVNPDISAAATMPDDCFLLCSDGFWGQVDIDALVTALPATIDQSFCDALVKEAAIKNGKGGDNISLVLARAAKETGAIFAFYKRISACIRKLLAG